MRHSPALAVVVFSAACSSTAATTSTTSATGSSTGPSGGGAGGGAATSTATTGATTGASVSATSSTGSGAPCTPLSDASAPNPTPGACVSGAAVTCAKDGTLSSTPCAAGSTCETYALDEWVFNGSTAKWAAGRTVTWAGCKPNGTLACTQKWSGDSYVPAASICDGTKKEVCTLPPRPDFWNNFPQLQYGTTSGWLTVNDCGAGTHCAASMTTTGDLTCIADGTPPCDGTEPACVPGGIAECEKGWAMVPGYRFVNPCPTGQVCYPTTGVPRCDAPGEVQCDASFKPSCTASGGAYVICDGGYTSHVSCATVPDGMGGMTAGRCDASIQNTGWSATPTSWTCTSSSSPACVEQTAVHCDPSVDADQCNGTVAHRCTGTWSDVDCATSGLVCGVSHGIAGCRAPNAPACTPGQTHDSCSGAEEVGCCPCGHADFLLTPPAPPCVPGYEVRSDCTKLGASYTCVTTGPFVECHP